MYHKIMEEDSEYLDWNNSVQTFIKLWIEQVRKKKSELRGHLISGDLKPHSE
jgi:hypothetical protein